MVRFARRKPTPTRENKLKNALALLLVMMAGIAAAYEPNNSTNVAALMQTWQSRILAQTLPVDDAKNWSRRNMAKFGRLNAERLALAQRAATLQELEMVLVEAPVADGARLDVLMANKPLVQGASYTASITTGGTVTSWSFTVSTTAQRVEQQGTNAFH